MNQSSWKRLPSCAVLTFVLAVLAVAGSLIPARASEDPIPDWRGKAPGTVWLGPDVLWRPRDHLVFHLHDELGTGFQLTLGVRDLNTYCEGPRPVVVTVVGPSGKTLAIKEIPDDGIIAGNFMYHDGIDDVWMDFRYRGWHLAFSSGGVPPGKTRSPFLEHPERIFVRNFSIPVSGDGPGLYRVVAFASWDHWLSLTSDRPLAMGVHSGAGPLYLHGDRFREAWLYAPPGTQDIGLMVSEEMLPFNWTAELADESGAALARTTPQGMINFIVHRNAKADAYYRIKAAGSTTGACLAVCGLPALFAPDLATAKLLHGGVEVDAKGRVTSHGGQRKLLAWADSLKPEDLALQERPLTKDLVVEKGWWGETKLSDVVRLLALQDLDPASPDYGQFRPDPDPEYEKRYTFWLQKTDVAAAAAGLKDPDNPYYGDPALVRRVLLCRLRQLLTFNAYFWFDANTDGPRRFKEQFESIFDTPLRSQWVPMHDARHVISLGRMREVLTPALPDDVVAAWKELFRQWIFGKQQFEQGICSNQWCSIMAGATMVANELDSSEARRIIHDQITRITTKGNAGRFSPDPVPYGIRSALGYTLAADRGYVGAGFLTDGGGHDHQYNLETESHLAALYDYEPHPGIVRYLNEYYLLKTHLTLPKWGRFPGDTFQETACPTDSNHRTRLFNHKSGLGLPDSPLRAQVKYGDLWVGRENPEYTWPCLETKPFIRNFDNMYWFVNTPGYYAILYGGPANNAWENFGITTVADGTVRLVGYFGMHYGGLGRMPTKVGGVSAVFVRGCGPTLLCWNHNVMYSNVVWGRRKTPVAERCDYDVDPLIICSGYANPWVNFNEPGRCYTRVDQVPDAPLEVRRTILFKDDRIEVTCDLLATADLDLKELYECVPYFVDKRTITLYGQALDAGKPFAMPTVLESPTYIFRDGIFMGENPDLPDQTFRAFDIAAENGIGTAIIFDREYRFKQTQPQTYGNSTSAFAGFNLILKPQMQAGERQTVKYTILAHDRALTPETLRQAVKD